MKNTLRNKPPYAIESVDHALHLAQLLQQEGPLRVTDAADRLAVSASTAHRLLAMLVYRDFAEQGSDRRYRAGAALRRVEQPEAPIVLLRRVALPHLQALVHRVQETANIMLLVRDEVRFVATVECDQLLRVGDRAGRVLPAHLASGGKAMLSTVTAPELTELTASPSRSARTIWACSSTSTPASSHTVSSAYLTASVSSSMNTPRNFTGPSTPPRRRSVAMT